MSNKPIEKTSGSIDLLIELQKIIDNAILASKNGDYSRQEAMAALSSLHNPMLACDKIESQYKEKHKELEKTGQIKNNPEFIEQYNKIQEINNEINDKSVELFDITMNMAEPGQGNRLDNFKEKIISFATEIKGKVLDFFKSVEKESKLDGADKEFLGNVASQISNDKNIFSPADTVVSNLVDQGLEVNAARDEVAAYLDLGDEHNIIRANSRPSEERSFLKQLNMDILISEVNASYPNPTHTLSEKERLVIAQGEIGRKMGFLNNVLESSIKKIEAGRFTGNAGSDVRVLINHLTNADTAITNRINEIESNEAKAGISSPSREQIYSNAFSDAGTVKRSGGYLETTSTAGYNTVKSPGGSVDFSVRPVSPSEQKFGSQNNAIDKPNPAVRNTGLEAMGL